MQGARAAARAALAPALAALAVGSLALATTGRTMPGVFWDDGVYLVGARSLAAGTGYRFMHLPGAPAAVHFPPLWPALLALVLLVAPAWPASISWLAVVNPLLLACTAALATWWGARRLQLPPVVAATVAVAATATLPVLVIAHTLFSEPLFLALLFGTLLLTDRELAGDDAARVVRGGALAGVAAGCAILTRTAGVALVPAIVIALVVRRRRTAAIAAAASATCVVAPWQLWAAAHAHELVPSLRASYGSYLQWGLRLYDERGAGFAASVAAHNVVVLFRTAGIVLFPVGPILLRPLLVGLALVVFAVGAIAAGRRAAAAVSFLAAYALLVLPWPYAPERFLWAVWPVIALVSARGAVECARLAASAAEGVPARVATALCTGLMAFALVGHAWYTARGVERHWWDAAARTNAEVLAPVVAWVTAHTAPGDVVACDGEPYVHLATGRTVVPVHRLSPDEYLAGTPLEVAAADMRALIAENHPRWMVLSAAAGELAATSLLDGRHGTPRLERVADLPGGGAAFAVSEDRPGAAASGLSSLQVAPAPGPRTAAGAPATSSPNARVP